jgi:hypothetical protein
MFRTYYREGVLAFGVYWQEMNLVGIRKYFFVTNYGITCDKRFYMSAVFKIREYIEQLPVGEAFSANVLREYCSAENTHQILNQLVKAEELQRVGRGLNKV